MTLAFYMCNDDYRVLDKTVGAAVASYTGELREIVGDLEMEIVLPGAAFNTLTQCNYCYIDTFGKYYFREEYRIDNNCTIVKLKEDVRKNFATQIKGIEATIKRTEQRGKSDAYIVDDKYIGKAYKRIMTRDFPNELTDYSFILMTVG